MPDENGPAGDVKGNAKTEQEKLTNSLNKLLDSHGYGFQYAIAATANRLFSPQGSPWRMPVSEFPVQVRNADYHIDLILQHLRRSFLLVSECKRANPALGHWCFLRAPFLERAQFSSSVFVEELTWSAAGQPGVALRELFRSENIYNLSIEVRTDDKGDKHGEGSGAIGKACGQVLRGMNGLMEFLSKSPEFSEQKKEIQILPVIFTTARLWVTQANLGTADLVTGNLDLSSAPLEETRWVFLHYSQTPGLKHLLSVSSTSRSDDLLMSALYTEYVRTIAIVSAKGIEEFLQFSHWAPF